MPDEQLQRFSRDYAPGAVICREGEDGEEMYIIQKGKVRVSKRFAGKTHVVSVLEKGDFFGEMAIVNRIQRTATVTAIDEVELLVFDREGLQNLITRNARIALTIIDKLCRQAAEREPQDPAPGEEGRAGSDRPAPALPLPGAARQRNPSVPFQKCLEDISLSLELPMEEVRGVLGELQADGVLAAERRFASSR